jgi:hypothetical protein
VCMLPSSVLQLARKAQESQKQTVETERTNEEKLEGSAYLYGTTARLLEAAERASVAVNSRPAQRPDDGFRHVVILWRGASERASEQEFQQGRPVLFRSR